MARRWTLFTSYTKPPHRSIKQWSPITRQCVAPIAFIDSHAAASNDHWSIMAMASIRVQTSSVRCPASNATPIYIYIYAELCECAWLLRWMRTVFADQVRRTLSYAESNEALCAAGVQSNQFTECHETLMNKHSLTRLYVATVSICLFYPRCVRHWMAEPVRQAGQCKQSSALLAPIATMGEEQVLIMESGMQTAVRSIEHRHMLRAWGLYLRNSRENKSADQSSTINLNHIHTAHGCQSGLYFSNPDDIVDTKIRFQTLQQRIDYRLTTAALERIKKTENKKSRTQSKSR